MLQTLRKVLYYQNPSFIQLGFSRGFGRFLNSSLFQCIIGTKETKELGISKIYPQVVILVCCKSKTHARHAYFLHVCSISLEQTENNGESSETNAEPKVSWLQSLLLNFKKKK